MNTPAGIPTADIDGGCEGQDAQGMGTTSARPSVNAARTTGVKVIVANPVNVDGGGRGCALPTVIRSLPDRDDLDDGIGRHRPIASEARHEVLHDLAYQPRAVIIGLKLAAHPGFGTIDIPMIFFPVHSDCEVARA